MHNKFATIFFCLLVTFNTLHGQSFRDVSEVSGINTSAVDPVLMAGGVVRFDYNNDFYPDLLFVNSPPISPRISCSKTSMETVVMIFS